VAVVVLTVDQRASRAGIDAVPGILATLNESRPHPPLRRFERTAGDEIQGVLDDPETTVAAIATLLRGGMWSIGAGVAEVDGPLPTMTRAGRGQAFLCAREAVARAKATVHGVSVVGADRYRAEQLETVLWLWAGLLSRRTTRGREVHDLLAEGLTYSEAAIRLGISQSAISQRAQAAGIVDEARARELATQLIAAMLQDRA
jgi:hypothetical protein